MPFKRTLTVAAIVAVAVSLPFFGRTWNMFMHVFGAILFMGNIVVSAAWMSLARRSRTAEALRLGARGVMLTDAIFTVPGALLVLVNGCIIATPYFQARAMWVFVALGLFLVSAVVWLALLIPLQRRFYALMAGVPAGGLVPPEAGVLLGRWFRWGGIATLLPLAALVLMVFKPSFAG
jgi:uncharacterized membrane protein